MVHNSLYFNLQHLHDLQGVVFRALVAENRERLLDQRVPKITNARYLRKKCLCNQSLYIATLTTYKAS